MNGGIGFYCGQDKDIDAVLRCHFVPVTEGGVGGMAGIGRLVV